MQIVNEAALRALGATIPRHPGMRKVVEQIGLIVDEARARGIVPPQTPEEKGTPVVELKKQSDGSYK